MNWYLLYSQQTSVYASSLKLDGDCEGVMYDVFWIFFNHTTCSVNLETAVAVHLSHFNRVVSAVLRKYPFALFSALPRFVLWFVFSMITKAEERQETGKAWEHLPRA